MNTAAAAEAPATPAVRWHVVGFCVKQYQACAGAPLQPGGCCERCGQGIKYVVTIESADGRRMEVGQDCAVTMEGGPELAAIRAAERAYEHELYLQSDEYKARQARDAERQATRAARVAAAPQDHALAIYGLQAIAGNPHARRYAREYAATTLQHILAGDVFAEHDGRAPFSGEQAELLADAVVSCWLPAPKHLAAPVGTRVRGVLATYVRAHSFDGHYGRTYIETFVADDGAVLVWMGSGWWPTDARGQPTRRCMGTRVRLTGTVKAHDAYEGMPQTMVSRCKVEEV